MSKIWNDLGEPWREEDDLYFRGSRRLPKCKPIINYEMDEPILYLSPHYTNDRFREPQTVWGAEEKGIGYDYSDRIWEWDWHKADEAAKFANTKTEVRNSARWCQEFLSAYWGKPVILRHIMSGFNLSNGYPYQIFGYKFDE